MHPLRTILAISFCLGEGLIAVNAQGRIVFSNSRAGEILVARAT